MVGNIPQTDATKGLRRQVSTQKNNKAMAKKEFIYKVKFRTAPIKGDKRTEFFFGSITAIFSVFPEKLIGTNAAALWSHGLSDGNPYYGQYCWITAEPLMRNPQKR